MGVVIALRRDYTKKIDPCRMLVWLGRRTVPWDRVSTRVIWQAGTNWAGPVLIQIYYGDRVKCQSNNQNTEKNICTQTF